MIKITLTKNSLHITGHAQYAPLGKDIVCAAVSILAFTFMNTYQVQVNKYGNNIIDLSFDDEVDTKFIRTGFKLIEEEYPNNVRVFEGG